MKYVAVSLVISVFIASLSIWYWKTENQNYESEFAGSFGNPNPQFRNTDTKNLSPYAMFGDSSLVMMTEEEKKMEHFIDVLNPDETAKIQTIRFEPRLGYVSFLDKEGNLIGKMLMPADALARWLSTDPKAHKFPALSPYHALANNPIITIDPDGAENIIVVGNQGKKLGSKAPVFMYEAVNRALKMKKFSTQNGEQTTLLVYAGNNSEVLDGFDEYIDKIRGWGLNVIVVHNAKEVTEYVNNKMGESGTAADRKTHADRRDHDLITDFLYVGHGGTENMLLSHDDGQKTKDNLDGSSFSPDAFHYTAKAELLSCGSACNEVLRVDKYVNPSLAKSSKIVKVNNKLFNNFKKLAREEVKGSRTTISWKNLPARPSAYVYAYPKERKPLEKAGLRGTLPANQRYKISRNNSEARVNPNRYVNGKILK